MQHSARNQQYQVRSPCDGKVLIVNGVPITIKVTGEESDGACTVFESTVPPHFSGQPAHLHPHATTIFYIISGVLAFTLAEETLMVRQGSLVQVPPGLLHKFWNPTAAPATYLAYISPAGFEQESIAIATDE